jgi:hypothetical protein
MKIRLLFRFWLFKFWIAGLVGISMALTAMAVPELAITKTTPLDQQPFWKKKPDLMRRIREDRTVFVSVRRENMEKSDLTRFTMAAVGEVSRDKEFCFRASQDYPRLKDISDHFRSVNFDPATNQLVLVTEAMGYEAHMTFQILPVSEDWRSELQWQVILGHFKGMTGLIGFERVDATHTEMSMTAKYEAKEFPLPKVLMGFALEVIMKRVAEKMRAFIEAQPTIKDGHGVAYEPFAEGWLQGEAASGRPVDILLLPDRSMLVSDDFKGAIYRISYQAPIQH